MSLCDTEVEVVVEYNNCADRGAAVPVRIPASVERYLSQSLRPIGYPLQYL